MTSGCFAPTPCLALATRGLPTVRPIESSGPIYDRRQVEGGKSRIHFTHAQGLKIAAHPKIFADVSTTVPTELQAFGICGADEQWHPTKA